MPRKGGFPRLPLNNPGLNLVAHVKDTQALCAHPLQCAPQPVGMLGDEIRYAALIVTGRHDDLDSAVDIDGQARMPDARADPHPICRNREKRRLYQAEIHRSR